MAVDCTGVLPLVHYCAACGAPERDEECAMACCGGPIKMGYLCPICGFPHDTEAEAIACCGWDQTPEGARTARQRIEEAGQLAMEI